MFIRAQGNKLRVNVCVKIFFSSKECVYTPKHRIKYLSNGFSEYRRLTFKFAKTFSILLNLLKKPTNQYTILVLIY